MKKEWYVVNTVSGYEYKVKEKLDMMIKNSSDIQESIFRVIVPEQTVVEYKDGVKKEKIKTEELINKYSIGKMYLNAIEKKIELNPINQLALKDTKNTNNPNALCIVAPKSPRRVHTRTISPFFIFLISFMFRILLSELDPIILLISSLFFAFLFLYLLFNN